MAFEMSGVCRSYQHFSLQNINLKLPLGGIMGLIGPNGAGKSTTIRILMGLIAADEGSVAVMGHAVPAQQVAAKQHMGYASDDLRLYKNATLRWHMDFIQRIFPQQWDESYAQQLLSQFDLVSSQKIKGLSHGQRVKAGLLLILARKPRLLVLDEPTAGLDPVARKEVLNEMMAVLADDQRSILFSSHNTQDVEQLSDQITFIDRGQIVSSDDKESFLDSWRRIRLKSDAKNPLLTDGHITEVRQQGHSAVITVKNYHEAFLHKLKSSGAQVQQVDCMSLEEIFVAEVEAKRNRSES